MNAVLEAREPSARYLAALEPALLGRFDLIAQAPNGIARLRELILRLAVQGKLVPQDPNDEPASALLERIRAEKAQLVKEGKIRKDTPPPAINEGEKPFGLPAGWEWVRFGEISINRDGERRPVSSIEREGRAKSYDYYGASGVIDKIDGYLFDKTLLLIGEDGANLINRSTPIAFLAHGKYWVNNHAHVVDTAYREVMNYLCLYINSISLESYVTGTAQPKMNQAKLNSIVVALPPLVEQSRIVARVEELMALCDALETKGKLETGQHARLVGNLLESLANSESAHALAENWQRIATHFDLLLDRPAAVDALEQTILQLAVRGLLVPQNPADEPASTLLQKIRSEKDRLIATGQLKRDKTLLPISDAEKPFDLPKGWEWVRLNYLLLKIGAGSTPLGGREVYVSEGIKFLRSQNVWNEGLRLAEVAYIKPETHQKMAGTKVLPGDILFNITGASIGRCAVVPRTFDEANVSQHVTIIRPALSTTKSYLHLVLISSHVQQTVMDVQVGVSREGLSIGKLGQFLVPIPPIAEQSRIVARVAELHAICAQLRDRLATTAQTQSRLAETLIEKAVA